MNDRIDRLNDIRIENFIWIIYIGIILLSWYSNYKEKIYLLYNDEKSKKEYRDLIILIFSVLVIVYFYFTKSSYEDYIKLKDEDDDRKKNLYLASFIGSFLVLISGVIFLSIAIMDENIDVELAFN
jgi:ATP/ADP translocase